LCLTRGGSTPLFSAKNMTIEKKGIIAKKRIIASKIIIAK
jgi:hypothetical protein